MSASIAPAVAAGHRATAEIGADVLADGGSAADAAVAASLASCVAETLMTGLLGGGFAIHYDAATRVVENLDFFVTMPGLGAPLAEPGVVQLAVPFGEELVHYAVGPATFGVPGVPAGLDALWQAHGRLPWPRLVEPARALAAAGAELSPAHARCLVMLEPVMTMNHGGHVYAPGGRLLHEGERVHLPGLAAALDVLADEGGRSVYAGTLATELLTMMWEQGGLVTRADLGAYEPIRGEPLEVAYAGRRVLTRGGLAGVAGALARLPSLCGAGERARVRALVEALSGLREADGHTTNISAADADGNVCVLTTSLGLGSGDWVPGLDLHLNSMLGEVDLLRAPLAPGERMESMMAPTLVLDREGTELAIGSAGGTRLRTALVGVAAGVLDEGLEPQEAVDRPRFHPVAHVVNAEPGVDEAALAALEEDGWAVRRWADRHHYFGGVSLVGRAGAAADPRRTGAVRAPGRPAPRRGASPRTRTPGTPGSR